MMNLVMADAMGEDRADYERAEERRRREETTKLHAEIARLQSLIASLVKTIENALLHADHPLEPYCDGFHVRAVHVKDIRRALARAKGEGC
jgi:hypothetical protein